jgi:arabinan endo-1,5-alpha-L-arabinosidase
VAPFRHAPLSLAVPAQAAEVASADAVGSYKLINHGKDISSSIKASTLIQLASDGSVSGSASGSWTHLGNNRVRLSLGALGDFNGVLSRQWNTNASAFVVTFTAQSTGGVSLWGARISA